MYFSSDTVILSNMLSWQPGVPTQKTKNIMLPHHDYRVQISHTINNCSLVHKKKYRRCPFSKCTYWPLTYLLGPVGYWVHWGTEDTFWQDDLALLCLYIQIQIISGKRHPCQLINTLKTKQCQDKLQSLNHSKRTDKAFLFNFVNFQQKQWERE